MSNTSHMSNASEEVVSDVYGRADVPFERISAAICL